MKAKLVQEVLNEGCGCGGKKRPRPTIVPTQRPTTQRPTIRQTPRVKKLHEKFSEKGDPIRDMGIGSVPMIHKWFKTWAPYAKYTIDNDLNIFVGGFLNLERSKITKLPDNLSVGGDLDLGWTNIRELPDNLSVGGNLWLQETKITKLPKSLKVKGDIFKDF